MTVAVAPGAGLPDAATFSAGLPDAEASGADVPGAATPGAGLTKAAAPGNPAPRAGLTKAAAPGVPAPRAGLTSAVAPGARPAVPVAAHRRVRAGSGGPHLWVTAALALVTVAAVVAVAGIASGAGTTGEAVNNSAPAGVPVPAEYLGIVRSAALSCPMLSPARLAGQLMANSQFDAEHTTSSGDVGLAGLTDVAWDRWKPAPQARRGDATANVVALAHEMCDLSGQLRVAKVPGDMWRNALAAANTSVDDVRKAGGVPAVASGYVGIVVAYASWYSGHEDLDVTPSAVAPVAPTKAAASPVPSKSRSTLVRQCNSTAGSPICLRLVDQQTGRCLAIQAGSNRTGTVPCPGDATSVWYWLQLGDGLPHIVNDATGTCLDANDNRDVYVFQCQAGDPWETWVTVPGTQALRQKQTGNCLDSSDAGGAYTWACQGAGDGNEQWQQSQS